MFFEKFQTKKSPIRTHQCHARVKCFLCVHEQLSLPCLQFLNLDQKILSQRSPMQRAEWLITAAKAIILPQTHCDGTTWWGKAVHFSFVLFRCALRSPVENDGNIVYSQIRWKSKWVKKIEMHAGRWKWNGYCHFISSLEHYFPFSLFCKIAA